MDDVLIDAPFAITQEMVASLRIDVVVKGSFDHYAPPAPSSGGSESAAVAEASQETEGGAHQDEGEQDMYALPRRLQMLQTVRSSTNFSVLDFVDRIQDQRDKFATK